MQNIAVLALTLLLWVVGAESSHFRGGTASWKHLSTVGDNHQIEFNFRFGWRRDFFPEICDDDMILNQDLGYDGGDWQISGGVSSDFPHSVETICTTYEPVGNWAYGYNSFIADVSSASTFDISFSGNAWISGLYFGSGSWSVPLIGIDLGARSDTGKPNNPPSALSPPVVRLKLGCPSSYVIPILDEDGDRVTCRYANTTYECGGICGEFPYFTLIEETCTIEYDGGGGQYLVPIALMIEDHPSQTITVGNTATSGHLSMIPLQFLVDIIPTTACNIKPSYPPTSIPDNTTIPIEEDGTFNDTVQVYPSRPGIAIIYFVVIGPVGMHASRVIYYGGDLYGCIITWITTEDQVGGFTVCYYAVDGDGMSSDQRCFIITVSDTHPCEEDSKGGCSETCVPLNSTYSCSCDRSCWNLHDDDKTCIPQSQLTCDGETIDLVIPVCASEKDIVVGTTSNPNPECLSIKNNSNYHMHFKNDQCGVKIESSAVGIQYKTNVYIYDGVDTGTVTRGEWIEIPMVCTLPASSNLTGSFLPEIPISGYFLPETVSIDGMGTFTFYFDFYQSSGFSAVYGPANYPIEVTTQEKLFYILGAVGSGDLEFFTEGCVATSEREPVQSTLRYAFIEDGCIIDPTVQVYTPATLMENRFSIEAFQFSDKLLATPENAEVFIQCSVVICVTNSSTSTRCSQGCLSSSTRRSNNYKQEKIVRFKSNTMSKNNLLADDEDEESPPLMQKNESPSQAVTNAFSLILDDDDNDVGNNAKRVINGIWITFLTVTISLLSD